MTRYSRQELYAGIGKEGQKKIRKATVAIVGVGALGSVSAELLCRAGVKKLILVDRDFVEESNLQRQLLFDENDVGQPKALAAQKHLHAINKDVEIRAHVIDMNFSTIEDVLNKVNIIIDGTDNLETRFLINEYSMKYHTPWIYGAAIQDHGFVGAFLGRSPCFNCIVKGYADLGTCDTVGVLNTITTIVASMQVNECIKIIIGKEKERLIHINVMQPALDVLTMNKDPRCAVCQGSFDYLEGRKQRSLVRFCRTGQFQVFSHKPLDLQALAQRLKKVDAVKDLDVCLVFKGMKIFKDRVLIPATTEQGALSLYARYIGQ